MVLGREPVGSFCGAGDPEKFFFFALKLDVV
jgi:hypothetical protein